MQPAFEKGGYYFWTDGQRWNVTKEPTTPPANFAYASAEAIAKLKGVPFTQHLSVKDIFDKRMAERIRVYGDYPSGE